MPENRASANSIKKKVKRTEKYVYLPYHVYGKYILYSGTLGTDGTRIFGSISFLQKRSLQKFDADKSSGIPPAADTDLVGVLDVIPALALFEEGAEAFLRKADNSRLPYQS